MVQQRPHFSHFSEDEKQWILRCPDHQHRRHLANTSAPTPTRARKRRAHLSPLLPPQLLRAALLLTCTRGTFQLATLSSCRSVPFSASFGGNFPLFLLVQTPNRTGRLVRKSTPRARLPGSNIVQLVPPVIGYLYAIGESRQFNDPHACEISGLLSLRHLNFRPVDFVIATSSHYTSTVSLLH